MRAYTEQRPDLTRVAMIRDLTDDMRRTVEGRSNGFGWCRTQAAASVDAALSQQQRQEER